MRAMYSRAAIAAYTILIALTVIAEGQASAAEFTKYAVDDEVSGGGVRFISTDNSGAEVSDGRPVAFVLGEATQGGLIVGRTFADAMVSVNRRAVRVSADGYFVFGFGRDATDPAVIDITRFGKGRLRTTVTPTSRTYAEQRLQVDRKFVTPPAETYARIRSDQRKMRATRQHDTAGLTFAGGFSRPTEGIVTGVYGTRRYFNGQPRQPHYGLDIAAALGTPVQAPAAGVVRLAEDLYFSGNTVVIDHGHGVTSSLLHLDEIHVNVGDKVKRDDVIGTVGATGRVTGPHLDWRINWFSARVDPAKVTTN